MATQEEYDEAVELLQQLGLKEYEARCFVALSRISAATAKQISDVSEVPRTRVYDATRVLEAKGLVEIQHTNPTKFRAVPLEEAVETLRQEYESRVQRLAGVLESLDPVDSGDEEPTREVWSLSGADAIDNRTVTLVERAEEEVVLVVGDGTTLGESLLEALGTVADRGVTVVVGTMSEEARDRVRDAVPEAEVFRSGLEWLDAAPASTDEGTTAISRLLLVDRSVILVSTVDEESRTEHAVFGEGFTNGLVVIMRRLMATGLLRGEDPGHRDS